MDFKSVYFLKNERFRLQTDVVCARDPRCQFVSQYSWSNCLAGIDVAPGLLSCRIRSLLLLELQGPDLVGQQPQVPGPSSWTPMEFYCCASWNAHPRAVQLERLENMSSSGLGDRAISKQTSWEIRHDDCFHELSLKYFWTLGAQQGERLSVHSQFVLS